MCTITKNFLLIVILFMLGFQTVSAFPPTVEELMNGFRNFFSVKQTDDFEVFLNLVLQYQADLVKKAKDEEKTLKEVSGYIFNFVDVFGFSILGFDDILLIAVDHSKLWDFSSGYFPSTENIAKIKENITEIFLNHFGINLQTKEEKIEKFIIKITDLSKIPNLIYKDFIFDHLIFADLVGKFIFELNFSDLTPKPIRPSFSDSKSGKKRRPEPLSLSFLKPYHKPFNLNTQDSSEQNVTPDIAPSSDIFPEQPQQKSNQDYVIQAKKPFQDCGLGEFNTFDDFSEQNPFLIFELNDDKSLVQTQQIEEKLILKYDKTGKSVELIPNEKLPPGASYICPKCAKPVDGSFGIRTNGKRKVFECKVCQQKFSPNATIVLDLTRIKKTNSVLKFQCFCGNWHEVPMALNSKDIGCFNCSYLDSNLNIYLRMKNKEIGDDGFGYHNKLVTMNFRILQEEEKIKKTKFLEFKCPNPNCNKKERYDKNFDLEKYCEKCHKKYHKLPYTKDKKCPHCDSIFSSIIGKVTDMYKCSTCGEKFYLQI